MRRRSLLPLVLLLVTLPASGFAYSPQEQATAQDLHQKATELYLGGRFVEALPLLEQLYAADPSDVVVEERYGYVLLATVSTLSDPAARKQQRAKGRKLLIEVAEKTKANGHQSQLATLGYDIPEDGGDDATYSSSAEVQRFMQKGEDLFAKASYDEAIEQYQAALTLDPKLYSAALFIGDTYFKKLDYKEANQWFLRAVEIDPNIETAHRYWGDSLMKSSQSEQARDQYIEAIIAEPYNRRSWFGLINWANAEKKVLSRPALRIPVKVENGAQAGNVNITLDAEVLDKKGNDGAAWVVAYSLGRAAWRGEKFQKNFPQEKQYRHSLAEEVDSFNLALSVAKETNAKDNDKDLELIRRLSEKGLLEAFILISRPDEGVAQDYDAYRKDHREQLRQYIKEYVISK